MNMLSISCQLLSINHFGQPFSHTYSFYLVCSGALVADTEKGCFLLQTGEFLFLQPYQPYHLKRVNERCEVLLLTVHPDCFMNFFPEIKQIYFSVNPKLSGSSSCREIRSQLIQAAEIFFTQHIGWELLLAGQIYRLFHTIFLTFPCTKREIKYNKKQARLLSILQYCQEHYPKKFSVQKLADGQNLSASYLSHFFKTQTGLSLQEYICQLRLDLACRLISQTDLSLSDICFSSGFSDYRYFNQAFREQFHCTAHQYRQNAQAHNRFYSQYDLLPKQSVQVLPVPYALDLLQKQHQAGFFG
ncbi:helix-turn-helix transcriptional regulator [Yeguia hominis]|uniref:Helix-turn-helix transcriptional regulator n=1 Tax=Yeguia hominis TaxID=2763662 RepID=A0A926HRI3_9FIRM|nr:helix-turn-helix transcriptional regulator [Yeguia hominis]MBC8533268.1 helix-turn-helix transcriptional regulator [Yeguia hominis]